MLSRSALVTATLAAYFGVASAILPITAPSASIWWVAQSDNVLTWDCTQNGGIASFTVLLGIPNVPSPLAIVAMQDPTACSVVVPKTEVNQAPGTGYTVLFANPVNISDIYSTSDSFEIKPLGALYPSQVSSSLSAAAAASATSAAAAAASSSASAKSNGAFSNIASFGLSIAAAGTLLGLMTL